MGVRIPVRVKKQASRSESGIQREVLDALRKMGKFALRLQSGQVRVKRGYMHLCPEGTPDILVIEPCDSLHGSHVIWIEMKSAEGTQRVKQIMFEVTAKERQEKYVLARSLDDVLAALK